MVREISRTHRNPKDVDISISEIRDGIYRIAGFVGEYGITFNQFLINDIKPILIHTGPLGMYSKIEEKLKEVISIEKLRLANLKPEMIYPMHGSCIGKSMFSAYFNAIMKDRFAHSGKLLGQQLEFLT